MHLLFVGDMEEQRPQKAGKLCDHREPPLAVRMNGKPSLITPSMTARPTVNCNAMAESAAPSEAKIGARTRVR